MKVYKNVEIKKDCFAYKKDTNDCRALKYLVCRKELCPFCKTEVQNKREQRR